MSDQSAVPPSGTRQRLDHIDAMRPVKQAAVISTHAIIFLAPATAGLARANMLVFTHFSREAFLFVSSCMLAYSYRGVERVDLGHYWRRRFLAVGVPYLAWTAIYFFYVALLTQADFPYYHLSSANVFSWYGLHHLVHLVATGYYHLYYLLVLLEFYVVFPWVLRAVRRAARWHGRLVLVFLAWQVVIGLYWPEIYAVAVRAHVAAGSSQGFWETRLITSYALYLVAGVVVALHLDDVHDWICAHRTFILSSTLVAGALAVSLNFWHGTGFAHRVLVPGYNPFCVSVIPYVVGAILCVYLLGVYLVSPRRSPRTRAIVKSGSDNSYGIYLSQLIWIPLLARLIVHFHPSVWWPVVTATSVVIVYMVGFGFSAVAARTPLARPLTGRGQVSWATLVPRWRRYSTPPAETVDDGPFDLTKPD
jgi:peptidoglycan/LPS O-acetylase OafA/YrhL